jgi:hypothetical protein
MKQVTASEVLRDTQRFLRVPSETFLTLTDPFAYIENATPTDIEQFIQHTNLQYAIDELRQMRLAINEDSRVLARNLNHYARLTD